MNILYLTFSFTTGGTERLLVDICNEMINRDHNVFLYVINDHFDSNMLKCLDSKVNIVYGHKKSGGIGKVKAVLRLNKFIRKNKIEVVHCNAMNTLETLFLKKLLFPKVKILYTIHCMNQFVNFKKKRIHYLNRICDSFIAISTSVKQNAIDSGIDPNKITIVYNAINLNKFQGVNEKPFNPEAIVFGIVARLVPEMKGQDILIDALGIFKQKYKNFKCYFAGKPNQGEEYILNNLQNQAAQNNVSDNCVFLGNVEDIETFLKGIDIFVLPSRNEGFGISLIEAMVLGVPCLSSNVDGPAEISENGTMFTLFKSEDPQDLALKLEEMIENYSYHKEKTLQNIEYIKEKYNIITMCNLLEDNYF